MIDAQAYVLRESGKIPELEEIQVEDELERGQVLAKVRFTSLCGTQLEEIFTSSRNGKYMPHLFGHEASAEVIAVGADVTNISPGERVVIHWRKSSMGLDANPGKYRSQGTSLNAGKVVTLSTHVVVPENRVTAIPPGVEMWVAPLLGCSFSTGWGSVMKTGGLNPGEVTLVIGLGGVGRASAIAVSSQKDAVLYAVESRAMDRSDLDTLGVKKKFDSLERVFHYLEAQALPPPDLVVDTVGLVPHFELLLQELPSTSRIVLVGMSKEGARPALDTQRLLDGLKIAGSNGGDIDPGQDFVHMWDNLEKYIGGIGTGQTVVTSFKNLFDGINRQANQEISKAIYKLD